MVVRTIARCKFDGMSYQSLHVTVKSMSVVATEFGVGTLERRVFGGLRLLDAGRKSVSLFSSLCVVVFVRWD